MIESGAQILGKSMQQCLVSLVELFRKNSTGLHVIKEWIHRNSPINLNLSEKYLADNNSCFLDFMLSMDDFHLSLILCVVKDALVKELWMETELSDIRNQRLINLFAMAHLYYSMCFKP
ncbi:hypothetical protein ACOMHN_053940 [Nucella lapillus]